MKNRCQHKKVRNYAKRANLDRGLFRCPDCNAAVVVRDQGATAKKDTHSCSWAVAQELPDAKILARTETLQDLSAELRAKGL